MRHRSGRAAARVAAIVVTALTIAVLAAPAVLAAGVTVRIGSSLDPVSLTVATGTTVTWVNDDVERHRVRSTSGPYRIDSGNLEPGERYTLTFTTPGTWQYEDHRNRGLAQYRGTVTVTDGAVDLPTDTAGAAPPKQASVQIADRAFGPAHVTIAAGGTVRWANGDDREHTVSATDGSFGSSVLGSGDGFEQAFDAPGTYRYLCAIHPEMTGVVAVEAAAAAAPLAPQPSAGTPSPTPTPSSSPDTNALVDEPVPTAEAEAIAPAAPSAPALSSADPAQVAATQPATPDGLLRQVVVLSISVGAIVVFAGLVRSVAEPRRG
ncbi:MAG TPA: cupredoxin domain-containing protein [Candidatus Limnocylindrales bacterium]|nr:cupredoxin domain-containing protein [Candidatus Limnocylindrales bacterium]